MSQFVFAGLMGYLLFDEVPAWSFYIASVLMVTSAWVAVRPRLALSAQRSSAG
jgi:drug/metabolite transporter (DMT)-like permease